eukprot:Lithocolla_globosa_v1_NODE_11106_length_535_cov_5.958333.p2 type:complete len:146 gc:universal NODE_11106_length_535_cov_5.958333:78-515(+)
MVGLGDWLLVFAQRGAVVKSDHSWHIQALPLGWFGRIILVHHHRLVSKDHRLAQVKLLRQVNRFNEQDGTMFLVFDSEWLQVGQLFVGICLQLRQAWLCFIKGITEGKPRTKTGAWLLFLYKNQFFVVVIVVVTLSWAWTSRGFK